MWNQTKSDYQEINGVLERVETVVDPYGAEQTLVVCSDCTDPFPSNNRCERCGLRLCDVCATQHDCGKVD